MRLLMLAAEYPPIAGGVASYAHALARGLARRGHDLTVLTMATGKATGDADAADGEPATVRLRSALNRRYLKILPMTIGALWTIRRQSPDAVICARLSHEGVAGMLAKRLTGTPMFLIAHGSEILQHRDSALMGGAVRRILLSADGILANSHYTADLVTSFGASRERVEVVNPPFDAEVFREVESIETVAREFGLDGKRVLLTIGQLTERKGHRLVMQALAGLRARYPNLVYVVAGSGGELSASLRRTAERLGVADRVVFVGRVEADVLAALYTLCEIYVMPTSELWYDVEGFGCAFVEAGFFGKPVIGGVGGGVADAIVDGRTGVLVNGADQRALEKALIRLLDDPRLRTTLGAAGHERSLTSLSIDCQSARADEFLQRSLSSPVVRFAENGVQPTTPRV